MAAFIRPRIGKSATLLATMHKGFCSNGNTLIIEMYETDSDLPHDDRREV